MLLRRVTQHIRNQNWFAVFLDFVIVVIGILIAFQITEWNEARDARAKEQVYLDRLDTEMGVIIERLQNGVDGYKRSFEGSLYLINELKRYADDEKKYQADIESLKQAFFNLELGRVPASSPSVFKEMVANGELQIFSNTKLRQSLYEFDEYATVSIHAWQFLRQRTIPGLERMMGILTYEDHKKSNPLGSVFTTFYVPDKFDLNQFLEQKDLTATLSYLMLPLANQLALFERQLQLAQEIQAQLAVQQKTN